MTAWSASQRRTADSTSVLSTALRSKVERLMTLSTSAVAVCCWSDSRSSLSSRGFSMAMTALAAKFLTSSICLSVKWQHLLTKDSNCAKEVVFFQHWHDKKRSSTGEIPHRNKGRVSFEVERFRPHVGDLQHLLRGGDAGKRVTWADVK